MKKNLRPSLKQLVKNKNRYKKEENVETRGNSNRNCASLGRIERNPRVS